MQKDLKKALATCSTWVTDASGERRKDCISCPYQDPADPFGLECGEKLMRDAGKRIEDLEEQIRLMSGGTRE